MSDIRENIKQVLKEYTEEELYDYKPSFSAEDLLKYVESEWDIEMLEMIDSKIQERIEFLNHVIGVGSRKEIKGFKQYND
jgi:hypothetical protein